MLLDIVAVHGDLGLPLWSANPTGRTCAYLIANQLQGLLALGFTIAVILRLWFAEVVVCWALQETAQDQKRLQQTVI